MTSLIFDVLQYFHRWFWAPMMFIVFFMEFCSFVLFMFAHLIDDFIANDSSQWTRAWWWFCVMYSVFRINILLFRKWCNLHCVNIHIALHSTPCGFRFRTGFILHVFHGVRTIAVSSVHLITFETWLNILHCHCITWIRLAHVMTFFRSVLVCTLSWRCHLR